MFLRIMSAIELLGMGNFNEYLLLLLLMNDPGEKAIVFSCTRKKEEAQKGGECTLRVFIPLCPHPGHVRIYISTTPTHKFTLPFEASSHRVQLFTQKLALESVSRQSCKH